MRCDPDLQGSASHGEPDRTRLGQGPRGTILSSGR